MAKEKEVSLSKDGIISKFNLYDVLFTLFLITFVFEAIKYIGFFDISSGAIFFIDEELDAIVFTGLIAFINIIALFVVYFKRKKYKNLVSNDKINEFKLNTGKQDLSDVNVENAVDEEDICRKIDSNSVDEIIKSIEKLGSLMEKGYITDDEFKEKKEELLKRI